MKLMKAQIMGKITAFKIINSIILLRNETSGMTSKSFTNTLKLAPIYACSRQVVDLMSEDKSDEEKSLIKFKVSATDVNASWEFVKLSMNTFKSFKVSFSFSSS